MSPTISDPPRKLLALDFDGVLHSYASGWKGPRCIPDPPVDGAMEFLVCAVEKFDVAIHSSRSRYWGGRRAIKGWLVRQLEDWLWAEMRRQSPRVYDDCYVEIVDHAQARQMWAYGIVGRISFPLWKPPAHVTLDDRAITFTGTWPSLPTIAEFKPWNRGER